jgi:hypothetical protein
VYIAKGDMCYIIFNNNYYNNIEEKGKNEQDLNMGMDYDTEQGIGSPVWIRVPQNQIF